MESVADSKAGSLAGYGQTAISEQYLGTSTPRQRRYKSARLVGEFETPWLQHSQNANRWRELLDRVIFYLAIIIGIGIGFFLCYRSYRSVPSHDYCLIMDDNFTTLDLDVWTRYVQLDGFGTGSFDWTTEDSRNSYVDDDGLHIVPTMTLETSNITYRQLTNNYTMNLTSTTCTARSHFMTSYSELNDTCTSTSNSTLGTIINPVRSARLSTKGKKSIKYGRVEVVAKLPRGDWLWPAIWMLPEHNTYGDWPASGEIDLSETRGNDRTYTSGRDRSGSTLHWGTDSTNDAWYKTYNTFTMKQGDFSDDFHTFGMEWSEEYLFTWIDNRNNKLLNVNFGSKYGTLWERGNFANDISEGTVPVDPWSQTGRYNTPFDESFYLILNVAVGSTSGYFTDGVGGKPWVDGTATAARDFWRTNETWLATWGDGPAKGLTVKSVKMWQEGKCA